MKRFLKTSIIALATLMTPLPAHADAQIDISVIFSYDHAKSADANYAKMRKSSKTACKVLDTTSSVPLFGAIQKAQRECVTKLVDRGVAKFAYPDLTLVHKAATGERLVRTAQAIN